MLILAGKLYAQNVGNCNPTGSDFKQRYAIDTICRTYPQVEVVNPLLYIVLDSLIDDVCRYNKDIGTMPYIGTVEFSPESSTNIRVVLENDYSRIDTANTYDDLSSEVRVFEYRGIDFYLFHATNEEMERYYAKIFRPTNNEIEVCYYKPYKRKGFGMLYVSNAIGLDFDLHDSSIRFIQKISYDEWDPLPR